MTAVATLKMDSVSTNHSAHQIGVDRKWQQQQKQHSKQIQQLQSAKFICSQKLIFTSKLQCALTDGTSVIMSTAITSGT